MIRSKKDVERAKSADLKPYTLFLRILSVIWSVIHAFETSNTSRDIWKSFPLANLKLLHDAITLRIKRPQYDSKIIPQIQMGGLLPCTTFIRRPAGVSCGSGLFGVVLSVLT